MSGALLEVEAIDYLYQGGAQALHGLSLSVLPGRRLAILGPNGCGKTTLLLHLNGTLRPTAGRVLFKGQVQHPRELAGLKRHVGIVLQDPDDQLFAASVYQDVSFGPLNLGWSSDAVKRAVEDALRAMDIQDLSHCGTHLLSFGQKKRVAIAGVLAMQPTMLVLDEPTAGLDSSGTQCLLHALAGLQSAGTTIVIATHDIDLAYAWADDVALMRSGRVVLAGPCTRVLADPCLHEIAGLRPPILRQISAAMAMCEPPEDLPRTVDALLGILQAKNAA